MQTIIISGPAKSGKTTIANALQYYYRKAGRTTQILGFGEMIFASLVWFNSPEDYETFKIRRYGPKGTTGRQLMINFSEQFIFPNFGPDYWMNCFLEEVDEVQKDRHLDYLIITGLRTEAEHARIRRTGYGKSIGVQLKRNEFQEPALLEGESYLGPAFYNNSMPIDCAEQIATYVDAWVKANGADA